MINNVLIDRQLNSCKSYIEQVELLKSFIDSDKLDTINRCHEADLDRIATGMSCRFKSPMAIDIYYYMLLMEELKSISEKEPECYNKICNKLDDILKKNYDLFAKNSIKLPSNNHLTLREYYQNYDKIKLVIRKLEASLIKFK